ncbi:RHS repeat domain-containing protein [Streptomyces sp. NPDC058405]|uniref:RHS repeat domain-containing protein n=1 Tax=Streptomyces sp. NPDC058405 TaxID=3346482 RepID=UPI00364DF901
MGAREYDPAIGQFISVDPLLMPEQHQSLNGYSYANQHPATTSDPTGMCEDPGNGRCHQSSTSGSGREGTPDPSFPLNPGVTHGGGGGGGGNSSQQKAVHVDDGCKGLGLPVQRLPQRRRGLLRRHQQRPAHRRVRRPGSGTTTAGAAARAPQAATTAPSSTSGSPSTATTSTATSTRYPAPQPFSSPTSRAVSGAGRSAPRPQEGEDRHAAYNRPAYCWREDLSAKRPGCGTEGRRPL